MSSPGFTRADSIKHIDNVMLLRSWEPQIVPPILSRSLPLSHPISIVSIGNIGNAHDVELLECLLLNTVDLNISFSFIGRGSLMPRLVQFCDLNRLNHITFNGFMSKSDCLALACDLSLIPFRDLNIADTLCFCFVSSLSVATPVISFGTNYVSQLVVDNQCGFVLPSSDIEHLGINMLNH